ncbi:MerR family transcriptional regulator [Kribbella sp. NPDC004536]|uniref:MerR family transcriptional regulator n=1 Tax=Kribbella sp. NPDC004536 TaxID=3364106 RepID=UPI00368378FD
MVAMLRLNVDVKSSGENAATLSIGEVADRFGLGTHVLRHWESMGLLAPARIAGSRRRYGPDDVYRIGVVLRAKEAGFGLDDIRDMITTRDATARTAILQRQRAALTSRIAAAETSLAMIDGALDCDHPDFTQCPHFRAIVTDRIAGG